MASSASVLGRDWEEPAAGPCAGSFPLWLEATLSTDGGARNKAFC